MIIIISKELKKILKRGKFNVPSSGKYKTRLGKKEKKIRIRSGNSRGGLTKTGHTDLRKTGLFK